MHRRTLLHNLVCGLAGAVLSNDIGNADAASGTGKSSRVGLQLYTVRKSLQLDFEATLRRVAELGIKEVEFAGYFDQPPARINKLLKRLGIRAPSAHISTETLRNGLPSAIESAKIIGHKYLVLGYLPEEERKSLQDYGRLVDLLNRAGEECSRAGLRLAYHNHDFEFAAIGGIVPYDLILAGTDPRTVQMEMDLYWVTKAGLNPVSLFEKHPGRFPLVHVKDIDSTPRKFFTEVGRGVIDFVKIFSKAKEAGIKHYFIEQDETPGDPLESVGISLNYLRALKF
jgi:sugar phosphate isomerase/epimerase